MNMMWIQVWTIGQNRRTEAAEMHFMKTLRETVILHQRRSEYVREKTIISYTFADYRNKW
jgi:hypothetical protein